MARNPCILCGICSSCTWKRCRCWLTGTGISQTKKLIYKYNLEDNEEMIVHIIESYLKLWNSRDVEESIKDKLWIIEDVKIIKPTVNDIINEKPTIQSTTVENDLCHYAKPWYREKCINCWVPRAHNRKWICIIK